jgi:hypothetical protein
MVGRALLIAVPSLFIGLFSPAFSHAQTGTLTVADSQPAGPGPGDLEAISVGRDGRLISSAFDSGEAVVYEMSQSGTPEELSRTPVGPEPRSVALAHNGGIAVIVNSVANEIASYRIERDGGLRELDRVSSGGVNPYDVGVAWGNIVLVANRDSDQINSFHVDRRGRLTAADVAIPGVDPHVVSVSRTDGMVAVSNQTERSVSIFEVDRRGRLDKVGTVSTGDMVPGELAWYGRDLFISGDRAFPGEDVIRRLRVHRNGEIEHISDTPAGVFLTGLAVTPRMLFAVTVNVNGPGFLDDADEVRAYRIEGDELIPDAAVQIPGPPSFKQVAVSRRFRQGNRIVTVNDYQDDMMHTLIYDRNP